ncbi:hypothetical protein FRB90_009302 [Tulasnella sp. 427]|nr:hypothetical protein FRB90_009302 [Tulasnella sp. 427]
MPHGPHPPKKCTPTVAYKFPPPRQLSDFHQPSLPPPDLSYHLPTSSIIVMSAPNTRPVDPVGARPTTSSETLPPAYGTPECPAPAYEEMQEPITMAKYLFQYGFLFPAFWIIGVMIYFTRLEPTPEAECGKTAAEQADEIALLRKAELKWSKRCAWALLGLIAIIGLIVLICFAAKVGVFKHRH